MATANVSWTACGSASTGQFLYYGKNLVVTGNPLSGTGWTLYNNAPLANTASSATITGLEDNVDYVFAVYCDCTNGNGPISNIGPLINSVCPSVSNTTPTFNGLSYSLTVPSSANNGGSWIQTIVVSVLNSTSTSTLSSQTFNAPFSSTLSSNFSGLNSSTNYNLSVAYSNAGSTRTVTCGSTPFSTAASCPNPSISVSNITSNSFDVSWTPTTGGSFDILVNGNPVATGLTSTGGTYTVTGLSSATIYQVAVRLNCTTGGTGISATQNVTTTSATINGIIAINQNTNNASAARKGLTMSFSFAQPTAFPITIAFGEGIALFSTGTPTYSEGYWGYDLFSVPPTGATLPLNAFQGDTCFGSCFSATRNTPWVVNIPQGVTTYTTTQDSVYTVQDNGGNPGTVPGNVGGFTYQPWCIPINFNNSYILDMWVRVTSPSGYNANFTITSGTNTSGISIHNV